MTAMVHASCSSGKVCVPFSRLPCCITLQSAWVMSKLCSVCCCDGWRHHRRLCIRSLCFCAWGRLFMTARIPIKVCPGVIKVLTQHPRRGICTCILWAPCRTESPKPCRADRAQATPMLPARVCTCGGAPRTAPSLAESTAAWTARHGA